MNQEVEAVNRSERWPELSTTEEGAPMRQGTSHTEITDVFLLGRLSRQQAGDPQPAS
jgi:hypothetical protein